MFGGNASLGFFGGVADKVVTSIQTTSGWTSIMNIGGDPRKQTLTGGVAYGAWTDGPVQPWRGSDNETYFFIPHSEVYRVRVPGNDFSGATPFQITPSGTVYLSGRNVTEADYDNRSWPYGTWHDGTTLYGIAHHEWYQTHKTVSGIPGFINTANTRWVNSAVMFKSVNDGQTLTTVPYTPGAGAANRKRVFLNPEPWATLSRETTYGNYHPSNVVKEGIYWYAFLDTAYARSHDNKIDIGFISIRWTDWDDLSTVQYWNGSSWVNRDMGAHYGNTGIQPYQFFRRNGFNLYNTNDSDPVDPQVDYRHNRLPQSIRFHTPSKQWLMFGYCNVLPFFNYCRSKTLANPQWETNGVGSISLAGGGASNDYIGNHYLSVFDPTSTDRNFMTMGNNPICIIHAGDHAQYWKQNLQINVA